MGKVKITLEDRLITKSALADGTTEFECICCNRKLNPTRMKWVERAITGGLWIPNAPEFQDEEEESQGCFPIGLTCYAKADVQGVEE